MDPRQKAKTILAAIVRMAGGSFNGKTRLYKAFYVAHLLHFRDHNGVLSDHPVVRMPRGPAVDSGDALLSELRDEGVLALSQRPVGPYLEEVFTLSKSCSGLCPAELESVRRAVEWIADRPATELSEWTHEFSNTWADTPNGRPMNIYADLLSESEYSELKERHKQAGGSSMPFLPDEQSTDRLLKNLAIDLMAQLDPAELRQFGWYQYRDFDHANTLVSTEFAADAFVYLRFDAHQAWRRNPKMITAILAFMRRYYKNSPQPKDLLVLKQLIETKPLDPQAIVRWFHAMYPPDPTPS